MFIENMVIGGVLLYLTGEICGWGDVRKGRFFYGQWRFITGSIMCGAFSMVIFIGVNSAVMLLMEVIFAAAVCTVVFGYKGRSGAMNKVYVKRRQWRHALTFILVTYFMGGIVMGILLVTQNQGIHTAAGIYTGDMKAAMLVLFICLGYVTIKQIIKTVRNSKLFTEHSYQAEIVIGGHIIKANAFLDTGNRLKDPMTGKPVAVASKELWEQMMRSGSEQDAAAMDVRFAIVPYEAVGTRGILEAIRTDHLEVDGRKIRGCLVARSERDVMLYDLLISGEMVDLKI